MGLRPLLLLVHRALPLSGESPLSGDWIWKNTTMSDGTVIAPQNAGRYGMRFLTRDRVDIFADCNRAIGRYSLDGDSIKLRVCNRVRFILCTLADARAFFRNLRHVTDVLVQGDDLYLSLETDSGTMHLTRQSQK